MIRKLICWLFGHGYVLQEPIWTGNNTLIIINKCSRCDKLSSINNKRPHNWKEISV